MANETSPILSVIATVSSKLPDLAIKNGQLIFVQDNQKIALDFNEKRVFYNQITVFETDEERKSLLAPVTGMFYFVISTAVLWTYQSKWIQLTYPPESILFIGTELPELGSENTLYINKEDKNISVWDTASQKYVTVSEAYESITQEDILALFN